MSFDSSSFDLFSFLEDRNIEYKREGKNVTKGWVELNCPSCGDPSFHLGVHTETNTFNCWRCGIKGDAISLVKLLEKCNYSRAKDLIEQFKLFSFRKLKQDILKRHSHIHNILPKEATKNFPTPYLNYLYSRGFDENTIEKYSLLACDHLGKWKFRIIIPIYQEGKIVNFTARDVTGKARSKYIHCSNENSIVPMKELLYNFDTVKDTTIIVEGTTDVWKIGDGCIATFGVEVSEEQMRNIKNRHLKKIFILFDSEELAQRKSIKLAERLTGMAKEIEILNIGEGDPGDLGKEEVKQIRQIVFGE